MDRQKVLGDYVLLVVLAIILGSNFTMTKISVNALPPMAVVLLRLGIASLFLFVVMIGAKHWFPKGAVWKPILASAFFGHTLPFALIAWGQAKVDAGLASILMATMPLFTLGLAQLLTDDEKPNRYSVAGFSLALVGIIVLFGYDQLASLADQSLRQYAIGLAALSYGVNAIVTKQLVHLAWQQMTASFMICAFIMSLPLLLFVDLNAMSAPVHVWWTILYTGIMPTSIGAIMIVILVKRTGASFLSQINFLVPVSGALIAILFLGEVLPSNAIAALFIILAGVAISRRRPKRKTISINKGA